MADDLVIVGTFGNVTVAHLAKSMLEAAGIRAFLENEHITFMAPHLASPSGVQLKVKRSEAEKAMELLRPQK